MPREIGIINVTQALAARRPRVECQYYEMISRTATGRQVLDIADAAKYRILAARRRGANIFNLAHGRRGPNILNIAALSNMANILYIYALANIL